MIFAERRINWPFLLRFCYALCVSIVTHSYQYCCASYAIIQFVRLNFEYTQSGGKTVPQNRHFHTGKFVFDNFFPVAQTIFCGDTDHYARP